MQCRVVERKSHHAANFFLITLLYIFFTILYLHWFVVMEYPGRSAAGPPTVGHPVPRGNLALKAPQEPVSGQDFGFRLAVSPHGVGLLATTSEDPDGPTTSLIAIISYDRLSIRAGAITII